MYAFLPHRVDPHTVEYELVRDGEPGSWADFVDALAAQPAALTRVLAGSPWPACFWECTPTSSARTGERFRMVLVEAALLDGVAVDGSSFAEHFRAGTPVVSCANLRGDARLVIPTQQPGVEPTAYPHLVRFCRQAPATQVDAVWHAVAGQVRDWWARDPGPLWLSTSGLGVAWLHVRLDSRPKYYSHAPYRQPPVG